MDAKDPVVQIIANGFKALIDLLSYANERLGKFQPIESFFLGALAAIQVLFITSKLKQIQRSIQVGVWGVKWIPRTKNESH